MGQYEGGYTSAINSQSDRTAREFTNQHLAQIIAERAQALRVANELQQRQAQARANAGMVLPDIFAAPPAGAPPMAGPSVRPMPGEASVPMGPPMGAPPQAADFGQGPMPPGAPAAPMAGAAPEESPSPGMSEPQAAPQPAGWQTGATAGPDLGGQPETAGGSPGEPAAVGAPPPVPKMPPQLLSVPVLIQAMQKRGIPPDQMVDALHQMEPIINGENRFAIAQFAAENNAQKAATAAYKAAIDKFKAENQGRNIDSLVATREGRLAQGERKLDQSQQALGYRGQALAAKLSGVVAKGAAAGNLDLAHDDETRRFMAERLWAGDRSVLQNLGRGAQGAQNILALNREARQLGVETGKSAQDLAAVMAEFEGLKAGERTAGTRAANIEIAANEAKELSTLAVDASEGFDRAEWRSINQIYQAIRDRTASPELRQFGMANNALINAYARAISPQGVSTVSDKDHAREILNTSFSKGDYAAGVAQLQNELTAALKAPGMAKKQMRERATGRAETPGDTGRAGSTAPAAGGGLEQQARDAIAKGADPSAVRARYKQQTGKDLP